jgi:hypothetical protein
LGITFKFRSTGIGAPLAEPLEFFFLVPIEDI